MCGWNSNLFDFQKAGFDFSILIFKIFRSTYATRDSYFKEASSFLEACCLWKDKGTFLKLQMELIVINQLFLELYSLISYSMPFTLFVHFWVSASKHEFSICGWLSFLFPPSLSQISPQFILLQIAKSEC